VSRPRKRRSKGNFDEFWSLLRIDREGALQCRETILLAEDDNAVLEICQYILEKQGYLVMAARTPNEALSYANVYPGDIHLLITDLMMPEMGGGELQRRLQVSRPQMKSLFISGYTERFVSKSFDLPRNFSFIQKPFNSSTFCEKVHEVLSKEHTGDIAEGR